MALYDMSPEVTMEFLPLTEPVLLILLSLAEEPRHGYSILKDVERMSDGRVVLSTGTLYVEVPNTDGKLRPVTVKTLITDGNLTAIRSDDIKEGDEIIVSLATARAGVPGGGTGAPGGGRRPF